MDQPSAGKQLSIDVALKSTKEHELIVANFKDNEYLLRVLRALFLGLEVSDDEKNLIRGLSQEIKKVIREKFLPVLDRDGQMGIINDTWLGIEESIRGVHQDTISQAVYSQQIANDMAEQGLKLLDDPNLEPPKLSYHPDNYKEDVMQKWLLGRNKYIRLVNNQLYVLAVLAEKKIETPSQVAKRIKKDSTQ